MLKGNVQLIFMCNPQKSLFNVCLKKLFKTLKITVTKKSNCFYNLGEKTIKSSSFCNTSSFHNDFLCNRSDVQRSRFSFKNLKLLKS